MNKIDRIIMQAYRDERKAQEIRANKKAGCLFVSISVLILIVQFILLRLLGA